MSVAYNPQEDSVNYPAASSDWPYGIVDATGPAGVPDNVTYVQAVNAPDQNVVARPPSAPTSPAAVDLGQSVSDSKQADVSDAPYADEPPYAVLTGTTKIEGPVVTVWPFGS